MFIRNRIAKKFLSFTFRHELFSTFFRIRKNRGTYSLKCWTQDLHDSTLETYLSTLKKIEPFLNPPPPVWVCFSSLRYKNSMILFWKHTIVFFFIFWNSYSSFSYSSREIRSFHSSWTLYLKWNLPPSPTISNTF